MHSLGLPCQLKCAVAKRALRPVARWTRRTHHNLRNSSAWPMSTAPCSSSSKSEVCQKMLPSSDQPLRLSSLTWPCPVRASITHDVIFGQSSCTNIMSGSSRRNCRSKTGLRSVHAVGSPEVFHKLYVIRENVAFTCGCCDTACDEADLHARSWVLLICFFLRMRRKIKRNAKVAPVAREAKYEEDISPVFV